MLEMNLHLYLIQFSIHRRCPAFTILSHPHLSFNAPNLNSLILPCRDGLDAEDMNENRKKFPS